MSSAGDVVGLADVLARLGVPGEREGWGALTDRPMLVVDVDDAEPSAEQLEALRRTLRSLPCPTLALSPRRDADGEVLACFDAVAPSLDILAGVRANVARAPHAAMVLAQLLRLGDTQEPRGALVAESLAYATLQGGREHRSWLDARPDPEPVRASTPPLQTRRDGDTLHITLDRPDRRNAYSYAMRDALVEALHVVAADASITRTVLDGAGPCFCSGGDLAEFGQRPDPATAHLVRSTRSAASLLIDHGDRVHAQVHGACIGAGLELAAFCGRVTATPDAFFTLPEITMGLLPGAGGTVSLPRRIGRQRTALLALSATRLDAPTALEWGLIDELS